MYSTRYHVLLLQIVTWFDFVAIATGETRCYCNDARCVRTSYMCKSKSGVCVTRLTTVDNQIRAFHYCAETLADETVCTEQTISTETTVENTPRTSLTSCCHTDMCNYLDAETVNRLVNKKFNLKETNELNGERHLLHNYIQQSVQENHWFKVAVIVVSLVGATILVILVVIALKILQNDKKQQQRLYPVWTKSRQFPEAPPLYLPVTLCTVHTSCPKCSCVRNTKPDPTGSSQRTRPREGSPTIARQLSSVFVESAEGVRLIPESEHRPSSVV